MELLQKVQEVREHKYGNKRGRKSIKFEDFAQIYLEDYAKLKKKSWKSDQKYLNAQLIPFFGGMELSEISPLHVNQFMKKRQGDDVKGSTINRELTVLKKALNLAAEWDFSIEKNPVKNGNYFSEEQNRRTRVLSTDEEEKLLKEAAPHLKPIIQCALLTGMRLQEILGLLKDDVDFSNGVITIRPENNKSGKRDQIPISSRLMELLKQRIAENGESCKHVFTYNDLPATEIRPIKTIRRSFNGACRRANIKGLQFRDLRRTFSTRLHEMGMDPLIIQRLLRHSSFRISEEVYIQSNIKQMKKAIESLEENEGRKAKQDDLLPICYSKKDKSSVKSVTDLISMN